MNYENIKDTIVDKLKLSTFKNIIYLQKGIDNILVDMNILPPDSPVMNHLTYYVVMKAFIKFKKNVYYDREENFHYTDTWCKHIKTNKIYIIDDNYNNDNEQKLADLVLDSLKDKQFYSIEKLQHAIDDIFTDNGLFCLNEPECKKLNQYIIITRYPQFINNILHHRLSNIYYSDFNKYSYNVDKKLYTIDINDKFYKNDQIIIQLILNNLINKNFTDLYNLQSYIDSIFIDHGLELFNEEKFKQLINYILLKIYNKTIPSISNIRKEWAYTSNSSNCCNSNDDKTWNDSDTETIESTEYDSYDEDKVYYIQNDNDNDNDNDNNNDNDNDNDDNDNDNDNDDNDNDNNNNDNDNDDNDNDNDNDDNDNDNNNNDNNNNVENDSKPIIEMFGNIWSKVEKIDGGFTRCVDSDDKSVYYNDNEEEVCSCFDNGDFRCASCGNYHCEKCSSQICDDCNIYSCNGEGYCDCWPKCEKCDSIFDEQTKNLCKHSESQICEECNYCNECEIDHDDEC